MTTFIDTVLRELERRKMSQTELADKANVARPYLSRVLAGHHSPTSEWMARIAEVLELKLSVKKDR